MIIIFSGAIGRFPVGGNAWVNMQHLIGLRALGHDVFYLEDCGEGSWVYDYEEEEVTTELEYPTAYIRRCIEPIGFGHRWIYRSGDQSVGMPIDDFYSICSQADLLIFFGEPLFLWRAEYEWPRRRIFIDVDPGFTQVRLANRIPNFIQTMENCERVFTIGQRIGTKDCLIPTVDRHWIKTVPPISTPHWSWASDGTATHFTSIMQWHSYQDVSFNGTYYGNKDKEFPKFIDLPRFTEQAFRIALTGNPPVQLSNHGWDVVEGWVASQSPESYRTFIRDSRAEFSIAKHGYVEARGGWFSDRSVCYLACGRPVLVQDTGLSDWLPTGKGLLIFQNLQEALEGINAINEDYEGHRQAARLLAEQYFSADKVLPSLLEAAMD